MKRFFELMSIEVVPLRYHLDVWGLKKLFSVGIRRVGVPLGHRQARADLNLLSLLGDLLLCMSQGLLRSLNSICYSYWFIPEGTGCRRVHSGGSSHVSTLCMFHFGPISFLPGIFIYTYVHACMYVSIYIYIYIYTCTYITHAWYRCTCIYIYI